MRVLLHFNQETEVYNGSNIITVESNERFFGDDNSRLIDKLIKNDNLIASLMILNDDYSVIKYVRFNEFIRTDGNLTVFLYNEEYNDEERLITISMRNNKMDVPEVSPFIEIMTDNGVDNICSIAKGRLAYFELLV